MTAAEFSMGQANGKPTEKLMDYYEERAKGGVGLIIPGICRVNDMYATSSFTQLAMSHDYHIEPMREFVGRIHRHGAKLGIQLHHPGRQGYASSVNSLPMILPLVEKSRKLWRCSTRPDAYDDGRWRRRESASRSPPRPFVSAAIMSQARCAR